MPKLFQQCQRLQLVRGDSSVAGMDAVGGNEAYDFRAQVYCQECTDGSSGLFRFRVETWNGLF